MRLLLPDITGSRVLSRTYLNESVGSSPPTTSLPYLSRQICATLASNSVLTRLFRRTIGIMASSSKPTKRKISHDAPISPPPVKRQVKSMTTRSLSSLRVHSIELMIPQKTQWHRSLHQLHKSHLRRSFGKNERRMMMLRAPFWSASMYQESRPRRLLLLAVEEKLLHLIS